MLEPVTFEAPFDQCDVVTRAWQVVERLTQTSLPIVLTGETGTGRSTLASLVVEARRGPKPRKPVFSISGLGDTTALSTVLDLMRRDPTGLVLLAHEVDALHLTDQRWLAQAINDQGLTVVATSRGTTFEPALTNALSSGIVHLPPLRERGEDVVNWFCVFALELARVHGVAAPYISELVKTTLRLHTWPGNLHEVRQRVERAVTLAGEHKLMPENLGLYVEQLEDASMSLSEAMEDFKRRYMKRALDRCGGNRTQAARLLRVDRRTMFRFLEGEQQKKR